jgi:hypothetical protein
MYFRNLHDITPNQHFTISDTFSRMISIEQALYSTCAVVSASLPPPAPLSGQGQDPILFHISVLQMSWKPYGSLETGNLEDSSLSPTPSIHISTSTQKPELNFLQ